MEEDFDRGLRMLLDGIALRAATSAVARTLPVPALSSCSGSRRPALRHGSGSAPAATSARLVSSSTERMLARSARHTSVSDGGRSGIGQIS